VFQNPPQNHILTVTSNLKKNEMSAIFERAFNRSRNSKYKRGGRKISDLGKLLGGGIPKYVVYYNLAQQSYSAGQYQNSLDLINKTIQLSDIDDWKQYAFKANVLEDLKDYKGAIENYEKAIDINLDDVNVYALYHQIGYCYLNLADDQKASNFYSYAIELKTKHPNTEMNPDQEGMDLGVMLGVPFKRMYNNRANANKNLGKLNEAVEDCKKSLTYDKNYSNPYLMLSQIYSQAGQEQKAVEFLKISAQLGNNTAISTLRQMEKINLTEANHNLNLPDFTELFTNDLKFIVLNIKDQKGSNFHLANELGYTMVYYAVELCLEFQNKGNGTIPTNIKDGIIKQVIRASENFCKTDSDFKNTIKEKFNAVLSSPFIVEEAIEFLNNAREK